MTTAIILVLVAIGSVVFHLLSPWWWTPIASNWGYVDDTIIITFWITGVVFIGIIAFMAYCVFRYRHREGRRAAYEPRGAAGFDLSQNHRENAVDMCAPAESCGPSDRRRGTTF